MDVTCANCGEPWDSYYLLFDVVWEWDLPDALARDFNRNPRFDGPSDPVRCAAQRAGWKFAGDSPVAVLHCPSCEGRERLPDAAERAQLTCVAAAMLGEDEDGLIVTLADL